MRSDSDVIDNRIKIIKESSFYLELNNCLKSFNGIPFLIQGEKYEFSKKIANIHTESFDLEPLYNKSFLFIIANRMMSAMLECEGNYITITVGNIESKDECPINKEILDMLKPEKITLKIQEKNSIIRPYVLLNLKTFQKNVYCLKSSSLDFKNDEIFLQSIANGLLQHSIIAQLEDIKKDPLWHLQQILIIGY